MKKYKILIIVSLIIVFGLGVTAGIFGGRYYMHRRLRRANEPRPPFRNVETMARELGLTEDQQARIREIFRNNEERFKALRSELHKRLEEMRGLLKQEIDAVITPEQKAKLETAIRRYEEERRALQKREGNIRREETRRPPDSDGPDKPKGEVR